MRKKDDQGDSIHCNQDKENCYIEKGDLVEVKLKKHDTVFVGELFDIGIRIQNGTEYDGIHAYVTIGILPISEGSYSDLVMVWIENIEEIKVLRLGSGTRNL